MKHLNIKNLLLAGSVFISMQLYADNNVFNSIVAQDGTGSFATIQDAIDAAPDSSATPYIIFIKAGHYHEHLYIPASKPNLHLVGQSRRLVRVSDDRVSGGPNASPVDVAATMVVHATDTYLEDRRLSPFIRKWTAMWLTAAPCCHIRILTVRQTP